MGAYESLSELLKPDNNPNSWSDDLIIRAIDLVNELNGVEWTRLQHEALSEPEGWLVRLTDALSDGPADKGFPILKQMLRSPFEKVALQAGNSIYSLLQSGFPGKMDEEEIQILKTLSQKHRLHGMVFANVIKRFDPGYSG